ncbi:MAG: alkaline shock response membrane anchor protein AmaP [Clostridia bacterium]|nr:alkaline shock response membrane anchor protein AmaP [Clostridia bacterium]
MKHPVLDRILILICALAALAGAAGAIMVLTGYLPTETIMSVIGRVDPAYPRHQIFLVIIALVLVLFAVLLINAILPRKKKRSSNFAIQHNENGMVRISVKALETLVQKVLDEHAEIKVVTSSMFSDEESIRVDVHIALQSDISMPLAISALQKQIKKYIEACSGVMVQEVRVYVDSVTPATDETKNSPYAIPNSLMGWEQEQLPRGEAEEPARITDEPMTDPTAEEVPETIEKAPEIIEDAPLFSDVDKAEETESSEDETE